MENLPALPNNQIDLLISQAIEQNVSVESLQALLAMRRELKAEYAREEYYKSLAEFQARCPIIKKNKRVVNREGRLLYYYAELDQIVFQVKELLQECGFSYMINTFVLGDLVTSTCISTHILGHTESIPYVARIGVKVDILTPAQEIAVASTYSKRYAFCNCYGIMTSDKDLDGSINTSYVELVTEEDVVELKELLLKFKLQEEDLLAKLNISKLEEMSKKNFNQLVAKMRK